MAHILTYHTHGSTRIFPPSKNPSNSSNPSPPLSPSASPQTYAIYAARYTHIYPSQSKVHLGTLPPTSRHSVTPMRALLSSILLAQRSALTRIEALKTSPHYAGTHYLPIHAEAEFRAELNDGVGFYLDIYSSSSEVISLLHKWPFDDATKGLIHSKRLPDVDLILQFDQLNEKLHKLGQVSLGYHVKYHYIPESENRAVKMDVEADLNRYAATLERIMKEKEVVRDEGVRDGDETEEELEEFSILETTPISKSGGKSILTPQSVKMEGILKEKEIARDDDETEEELEEPLILKTTPVSKSGGKSILTPVSKSGGKSILTPQSTPVQNPTPTPKPKLKLKLISRDPLLRQNSAPKAPES